MNRSWHPREVEWVEQTVPELPRHAALAFAARCARRASMLFRSFNPWAPDFYDERIMRAVEIVESVAAGQDTDSPEPLLAQLSEMIHETYRAFGPDDDRTLRANVSLLVLCSVNSTLRATREERADKVSELVLYALNDAFNALRSGNDDAPDENVLLQDLREISSRSQSQGWTDQTPVAPGEFGSL